MRTQRIYCGVLALLFASVSQALPSTPTTYDFAGTGNYCIDGGACSARDYWGTIVLADTQHALPAPDDTPGWVDADFNIQWAGGSFNPTPMPDLTTSAPFTTIVNGPDYDEVDFREYWLTFFRSYAEYASISLKTFDLAWLSELAFPDPLRLASGRGASNTLLFGAETSIDQPGGGQRTEGFHGDMNLTKLERQSVPEPGTLMLFALGLLCVPFFRRPRAVVSMQTRIAVPAAIDQLPA